MMPARKSEVALILCFALVISLPLSVQTTLELMRGERVQFTDVFRSWPASGQLRDFERTMEQKSWFQRTTRPVMLSLLFGTFRDAGAKAILGLDGWLFYRPDVRYLVEPNRIETDASKSGRVRPPDGTTARDSVVKAVVRFRDQLKERGIYLLVAAVPGKPSVYPDRLTRRAKGAAPEIDSPTKRLIEQLDEQGVATVDLHSLFVSSRLSSSGQESSALFLARDTHWTPRGVKLAASETASRLLQLGWVTRDSHPFITTNVAVCRWGDILEMTRIPGIRNQFQPELVWCEQVRDEGLGLLIPAASERPGACRHPASKSSVLVLGDSFSRIYQFPEPQSLGDMPSGQGHAETAQPREQTKRLLPGSAGFVSHLALALGAPVDAIVSDGGASTDVRRKLSTYPEILEGKKVVVWEFVERDIGLGREGWLDVPLPPKLDG